MSLINLKVEKAEATATAEFVLFGGAGEEDKKADLDFESSISKPESSSTGLGALLVIVGLALAVWVARRWLRE